MNILFITPAVTVHGGRAFRYSAKKIPAEFFRRDKIFFETILFLDELCSADFISVAVDVKGRCREVFESD